MAVILSERNEYPSPFPLPVSIKEMFFDEKEKHVEARPALLIIVGVSPSTSLLKST